MPKMDGEYSTLQTRPVAAGPIYSHIEMDGYKRLENGQVVQLQWEAPGQDGFDFRAVRVVPSG